MTGICRKDKFRPNYKFEFTSPLISSRNSINISDMTIQDVNNILDFKS